MTATANLQTIEIGVNGANMRPELALLRPTIGTPAVDVRDLYKQIGCFTYDPGLGETGICRSTITYVDGDNGVLLYRGYPIDALVENCSYLEICWLLLNGELPTAAQLDRFTHDITHHTMVNEQLHAIYRGFRRDAHPMAVMCGVVGALAAFYHDGLDIFDPRHRMIASHRLVAKMPTIAAMAYKYSQGQPFVYPHNDLGYAENFLNMLFSVPCEAYRVPEAVARALEAVLIMHADHEQNASTSAMRFVGSTRANPYACTAAAIAALWGPLHGGANEGVLQTLAEIGSVERIPEILRRAKDKNDPFRPRRYCAGAATRCSRLWGSAMIRSSSWQWNWSASSSPTTISSNASSIPISISTPASSSVPWGCRRRCSRRSLPWRAPSAGWRSGTRCLPTRRPGCSARASSTPGPPNAMSSRWPSERRISRSSAELPRTSQKNRQRPR